MAVRSASCRATWSATAAASWPGVRRCGWPAVAPSALWRGKSANADELAIVSRIKGNTRSLRAVVIGQTSIEKVETRFDGSNSDTAECRWLSWPARSGHGRRMESELEDLMKLISAAFGLAAICAVGVGAQTQTTRTETKRTVDVKDGKKITITGCLEKIASGGYMLTSTEYGGR